MFCSEILQVLNEDPNSNYFPWIKQSTELNWIPKLYPDPQGCTTAHAYFSVEELGFQSIFILSLVYFQQF